MSSSGATPAAPPLAFGRDRARADELAVSESVAFPELVWAHYVRQRELHEGGELHGPAEDEYRSQLEHFVKEQGRILNVYWCSREASAVAVTEKRGERVGGFLWRPMPSTRFHSATDWMAKDAPDLAHVLHTCETLAIRVSEVLTGTSERIAMQWILSVAGYVLGVLDQADGKPTHQEAAIAARRARAELVKIEEYYDRAGQKAGRLVYFWGMMIGVGALAVLAVVGAFVYSLFGNFHLKDQETQTFFVCYSMGAVGAFVSAMIRMASASRDAFHMDYEVGRPALRRVGSFRPAIGAIFAVVFYLSLRGDLLKLQPPTEGDTTFFYAALAFVIGFSERTAKGMIGGAERVLGGEPEEERRREKERPPKKPKPAEGSAA